MNKYIFTEFVESAYGNIEIIASLCAASIQSKDTLPTVSLKLISNVPTGEILSLNSCAELADRCSFVDVIIPLAGISAIDTQGISDPQYSLAERGGVLPI